MTGQQWSVFSLMEGEWVSEQATAGENTKILANGAVYDLDKGRIVANPGGGTTAITQANASALATLRWQQAREQAAEAGQIGLARISTDGKWTSALANIAEKQAERALRQRAMCVTQPPATGSRPATMAQAMVLPARLLYLRPSQRT